MLYTNCQSRKDEEKRWEKSRCTLYLRIADLRTKNIYNGVEQNFSWYITHKSRDRLTIFIHHSQDNVRSITRDVSTLNSPKTKQSWQSVKEPRGKTRGLKVLYTPPRGCQTRASCQGLQMHYDWCLFSTVDWNFPCEGTTDLTKAKETQDSACFPTWKIPAYLSDNRASFF